MVDPNLPVATNGVMSYTKAQSWSPDPSVAGPLGGRMRLGQLSGQYYLVDESGNIIYDASSYAGGSPGSQQFYAAQAGGMSVAQVDAARAAQQQAEVQARNEAYSVGKKPEGMSDERYAQVMATAPQYDTNKPGAPYVEGSGAPIGPQPATFDVSRADYYNITSETDVGKAAMANNLSNASIAALVESGDISVKGAATVKGGNSAMISAYQSQRQLLGLFPESSPTYQQVSLKENLMMGAGMEQPLYDKNEYINYRSRVLGQPDLADAAAKGTLTKSQQELYNQFEKDYEKTLVTKPVAKAEGLPATMTNRKTGVTTLADFGSAATFTDMEKATSLITSVGKVFTPFKQRYDEHEGLTKTEAGYFKLSAKDTMNVGSIDYLLGSGLSTQQAQGVANVMGGDSSPKYPIVALKGGGFIMADSGGGAGSPIFSITETTQPTRGAIIERAQFPLGNQGDIVSLFGRVDTSVKVGDVNVPVSPTFAITPERALAEPDLKMEYVTKAQQAEAEKNAGIITIYGPPEYGPAGLASMRFDLPEGSITGIQALQYEQGKTITTSKGASLSKAGSETIYSFFPKPPMSEEYRKRIEENEEYLRSGVKEPRMYPAGEAIMPFMKLADELENEIWKGTKETSKKVDYSMIRPFTPVYLDFNAIYQATPKEVKEASGKLYQATGGAMVRAPFVIGASIANIPEKYKEEAAHPEYAGEETKRTIGETGAFLSDVYNWPMIAFGVATTAPALNPKLFPTKTPIIYGELAEKGGFGTPKPTVVESSILAQLDIGGQKAYVVEAAKINKGIASEPSYTTFIKPEGSEITRFKTIRESGPEVGILQPASQKAFIPVQEAEGFFYSTNQILPENIGLITRKAFADYSKEIPKEVISSQLRKAQEVELGLSGLKVAYKEPPIYNYPIEDFQVFRVQQRGGGYKTIGLIQELGTSQKRGMTAYTATGKVASGSGIKTYKTYVSLSEKLGEPSLSSDEISMFLRPNNEQISLDVLPPKVKNLERSMMKQEKATPNLKQLTIKEKPSAPARYTTGKQEMIQLTRQEKMAMATSLLEKPASRGYTIAPLFAPAQAPYSKTSAISKSATTTYVGMISGSYPSARSQTIQLTQVRQGTRPFTLEGILEPTVIKQRQSQITKEVEMNRLIGNQFEIPRTQNIVRQTRLQPQIERVIQNERVIQKTQQITRQPSPTPIRGGGGSGVPGPPNLPELGGGWFGGSRKATSGRKYRYTPDITAALFGITSRKANIGGALTGYGIRPILISGPEPRRAAPRTARASQQKQARQKNIDFGGMIGGGKRRKGGLNGLF